MDENGMDENNMDRAQFFQALRADGLFGAHLSLPLRQLGCGNRGGTVSGSLPKGRKTIAPQQRAGFRGGSARWKYARETVGHQTRPHRHLHPQKRSPGLAVAEFFCVFKGVCGTG